MDRDSKNRKGEGDKKEGKSLQGIGCEVREQGKRVMELDIMLYLFISVISTGALKSDRNITKPNLLV